MKAIPLNAETEALAKRLIWFEPPQEALADPVRFMAYAMARATHDEMKVIRRYVDDADFLEALDNAPAESSIAVPGPTGIRKWAGTPRRRNRNAGSNNWSLS